ncbi:Uncharacterised protein [Kluyvera cryocrescens]|uniref:Uncharacterized protein n=1 Tax=Kluyvera cryocrescens TaxID=580 RepID=A0A485BFB4_KLUCR|nr:Uncharacterised protein [Kluyvera cryocrescens]
MVTMRKIETCYSEPTSITTYKEISNAVQPIAFEWSQSWLCALTSAIDLDVCLRIISFADVMKLK